ncbi:multidrug ABC transporter ATP-binding protein [Thalassotalea marina]|uniref:Multidrug ABC transporter ATP-binding protein n=2 Tax=Thalassotalea marina TaxID=1673741 RepID=A0A919BPQ8_9GAMM|nr:multidrug ABC transporter ATP-binding protein [Thalassotalea marina]
MERRMLTIRNLSKTYDNGVQALKSVSLDIEPGLFGLLGPNGAGKSSLMRTIATLQQPSHGQISFDNKDIIKNPNILRECLGYLPQEFGVYPKASCYELLNHLALLKGIVDKEQRKTQIDSLLHLTNLYDKRHNEVATYSGGMRQRFGIAQALLGDPKLIIVDEPTAGLDPQERNRFHNLLCEISENIVVILSTHIVEDVSQLCPNMAILIDGQIQLHGKPAALINTLDGRIWSKMVSKQEVADYRTKFNVLSERLITGKTQLIVESEFQPEIGFQPISPDLEDVYFSTLNKARGIGPTNQGGQDVA